MSAHDAPLWVPPAARARSSQLEAFRTQATASSGRTLESYPALHRWSVEEPEAFWSALWRFTLPGVDPGGPALVPGDHMTAASWFPAARLNVAELILGGTSVTEDQPAPGGDEPMFVSVDERGRRRVVTRAAAREAVGAIAAALRASGVQQGDRVAAWMPNTVETALVMLGAASIGAVFSSCSPDFGSSGVLDRFGQIEPVVLVAADGYTYGGKAFDRTAELSTIVAGLPTLRDVVVVPHLADRPELAGVDAATPASVQELDQWVAPHRGTPAEFAPLPFDHPWYVLFSSGTTGVPKCIVHRTGGVLLQHLKEHRLQLDLRRGDRVAYFTTCGWMMWNWLMSVPASGATAVLYEGNPFHPGPERLWDLAREEELHFLGVSAKYLDAVRKSGYEPGAEPLGPLRTLASTGSPLAPETFEWVMAHVAPGTGADGLHLASISGGTDLCACFVCGDPTSAVYAGEIQRPALGMAVDVVDEQGRTSAAGERGELVCSEPFPSMPLGFWGDGPLGVAGPKYRSAYFDRYPDIWAQGDFATWTEHGGIVIHGRSDTTLNPGGVRIGTAEIYRQVEQIPEVLESLVFGLEGDGYVRIVRLVRLAEGADLDEQLISRIRTRVREGCTPRHVPSLVLRVDDLPRTRSGKLVELAVGDKVNGREVRNTSALANPEALDDIAAVVAPHR